ncbi:Peptidyl-prolyl isomerase cwc27 [Entomophthora muscae]|uniref:Peptidyl-prolyl isomerase cwc27 n=1 Tax=Entomophthora muscae TaxID=34485 RepID=A0ACC2USS4_9FUNG|nr:Peptidyl-prolyl isomerase cwc27 [Entomophthora muscae]
MITRIFHRVVPGFIVQGGDPTGTGSGGESIYGKPFEDELHSRLRFNRRGLLGMANTGPNDNGSQFFFTLDHAEELQGKHTLFGKIEGATVFNVLKIGEGEVGGPDGDRPLYPVRVLTSRVIINPFDDLIPRAQVAPAPAPAPKVTKKVKKNVALLSFMDDDEPVEKGGMKSSHDLLFNDPTLSQKTVPRPIKKVETESKGISKDDARQVKEKLKKLSEKKTEPAPPAQSATRDQIALLQKEIRDLKRHKPHFQDTEDEPINIGKEFLINQKKKYLSKAKRPQNATKLGPEEVNMTVLFATYSLDSFKILGFSNETPMHTYRCAEAQTKAKGCG